jgi:hypothetical protein
VTTVSDAGLALLVKLQPNLRRLDLGYVVGLTHTGFRHLAKLTKLEELKMIAPKFDDRAAGAISRLPLRKLTIQQSGITATATKQFATMKRLEHLDLLGSRQLTDNGVAQLAALRSLKTLNVTGAKGVTDSTLRELATLPLISLDLTSFGCAKNPASAKFTDEGLAALAAMPSLRRVVISGASRVTEKGVNGLRTGTPKRDVVRGRRD